MFLKASKEWNEEKTTPEVRGGVSSKIGQNGTEKCEDNEFVTETMSGVFVKSADWFGERSTSDIRCNVIDEIRMIHSSSSSSPSTPQPYHRIEQSTKSMAGTRDSSISCIRLRGNCSERVLQMGTCTLFGYTTKTKELFLYVNRGEEIRLSIPGLTKTKQLILDSLNCHLYLRTIERGAYTVEQIHLETLERSQMAHGPFNGDYLDRQDGVMYVIKQTRQRRNKYSLLRVNITSKESLSVARFDDYPDYRAGLVGDLQTKTMYFLSMGTRTLCSFKYDVTPIKKTKMRGEKWIGLVFIIAYHKGMFYMRQNKEENMLYKSTGRKRKKFASCNYTKVYGVVEYPRPGGAVWGDDLFLLCSENEKYYIGIYGLWGYSEVISTHNIPEKAMFVDTG